MNVGNLILVTNRFAVAMLLIIVGVVGTSQIEFKSYVNSNTVQLGKYIKFSVETNQRVAINLPDLTNFRVLQGPSTSSMSSMQNINGRVTQSSTFTTSVIIQPKAEGKIEIGSATTNYNGKDYATDPIIITVTKGTPPASGNGGASTQSNSNLFTRIELSKRTCYQGEPVTALYKIYSRYAGGMSVENYDFPDSKSFWKEEIKLNNTPQQVQTINGQRFNVFTIKKEILYPREFGDIKVPAFESSLRVGGSFFQRGQLIATTSSAPTLKVKPLPSPKPSNFSNLVGSYSVKTNISKNELKVDEGIDLKMRIKGVGNLRQIDAPTVQFPTDFEIYDPEVKENIKLGSNGLSGFKEFQYLVIPRHHGQFEIPPIEFNFFDPTKGKYVSIKSDAFRINVLKPDGGQSDRTVSNNVVAKENVELLNKEIRHIKDRTEFAQGNHLFFGTKSFWTLLCASPLALILVIGTSKILGSKQSDSIAINRKKARKNSAKKLAEAKLALDKNDYSSFYAETLKALHGYVSDKMNLPISELSKSKISAMLSKYSVNNSTINELHEVIGSCEMAQYAPIDIEPSGVYETAQGIIDKIENEYAA